jgi:hypothetical protein
VFGCEARPSTFDNFKFLSLLQNDFFKKNILRLCPAAKRDPKNLTILNLSLLQNNCFFFKYILTLCLAARRDPGNLKILNFFIYFKLIF